MTTFILDDENLSYGYEMLSIVNSLLDELGGKTKGLVKEWIYLFPIINKQIDDLSYFFNHYWIDGLDSLLMNDGHVVLKEMLNV